MLNSESHGGVYSRMATKLAFLVLILMEELYAQIPNQQMPGPVRQIPTFPTSSFQSAGTQFQGVQAAPGRISNTQFQTVPVGPQPFQTATLGNSIQSLPSGAQTQVPMGNQLPPVGSQLQPVLGRNQIQPDNTRLQQFPNGNMLQAQGNSPQPGSVLQTAPGPSLQPFQSSQTIPQGMGLQPLATTGSLQNTIQNTVQQAQELTGQNSMAPNGGTQSSSATVDNSPLNGSIIRYNGKVFIAEQSGQMIEAPALANFVGQTIVNGQIQVDNSNNFASSGLPQNSVPSNQVMQPSPGFNGQMINGQVPQNNMAFPNNGIVPGGVPQPPMPQQGPFPYPVVNGQFQPPPPPNGQFLPPNGQLRPPNGQPPNALNNQLPIQNRQLPIPMVNSQFQNRQIPPPFFNGGRVPQNVNGQFPQFRPPLPRLFRPGPGVPPRFAGRPPFVRPPFQGPFGRPGPPRRQFG